MTKSLWVFKLFNSIKDETEVTLAELELRALFGRVDRVKNFFDIIGSTPLKHFCEREVRIQDVLGYEPAYGEIQGFSAEVEEQRSASCLARRLAYTREIIVVTSGDDSGEVRGRIFPEGKPGANIREYAHAGYVLLRIIPNQFFLEKSSYISKLSRDEDEVDSNVETLFSYPFDDLYRIPASSTMAVGKRLEDYFAIREEPSLYLTHIWHPYKAKFHAKMARAMINIAAPNDNSVILDNWSGSGTTNVEASTMGLRSFGLEINPLSALMSEVKCQALRIKPSQFKQMMSEFLDELKARLEETRSGAHVTTLLQFEQGSAVHANSAERTKQIKDEAQVLAKMLKGKKQSQTVEGKEKGSTGLFTTEQVEEFLIARGLIQEEYTGLERNLLLLALSGSISDLARRRRGHLYEVLAIRLYRVMYLRLYLFNKLNENLGIEVAESRTYVSDNRDPIPTSRTLDREPTNLRRESANGVVTSPPYSTAVDYIRNDFPQLTILAMIKSKEEFESLEQNMEGNPKARIYRNAQLISELESGSDFYESLPKTAKVSISRLRDNARQVEALRTYKFFKDMYRSLVALNGLMKMGGKACIVIGNNHYKIDSSEEEVRNAEVTLDLALREEVGFAKDKLTGGVIERQLEKTQSGLIRHESILVLEKVREASASSPVIG